MRPSNELLLNAADATIASQTSGQVDASFVVQASVMVIAAGGTITGTLKVQVSNDLPNTPATVVNWVDLSGQTVSVTGAGVFLIPKFDCAYQYMRVVYTKTTSAAGALISARLRTIGL